MAITPEEFKDKITAMVRTHYATNRTPLLLAHLGTDLDKADAWPSDRGQRSLKQLIKDCAAPDPDIVWDKRSPAQALPAFCIDTHDQPVYVRRSRPFKYEIGNLAQAESASKAKGLT